MKFSHWLAIAALTVSAAGCNQDTTGVTTVASGVNSGPQGTGSATLSWQAPTTNTDGAALTNLSGYRIYYGTDSSDLGETVDLKGVGVQTYVIDNLGTGTWYFAVRAITASGAESALSDVVSKTI